MPSSNKSGAARVASEQVGATQRAPKSTKSPDKGKRGTRSAPRAPEAYTATTWAQGTEAFELECPSGQKCLAKELDIMRLMELGLLDRINGLSGIINTQVVPKAKGQPVADINMESLLANKDALREVMMLVDTILCEAVVAPQVHENVPQEERVKGWVYADSVRLTDKFFVFNEVTGGLEQLAAFR